MASAETVTLTPVAVDISAASVVVVQLPEHPPVNAEVSTASVNVILKVIDLTHSIPTGHTSAADETIEMPVLYEEHGEVHMPTAIP